MKYLKFYVIGLFVLLILLYAVRSELLINKLRKLSISAMTEEIEADNTVVIPAENKEDLKIDTEEINEKLIEEHNETNFQDPVDDWESDVNEYIDFLPDWMPELYAEDRKAITHYKYSDTLNNYSLTLKVLYDYKHETFEISPHDLDFSPQKAYPFCLNAVLHSNSAGLRLDWDFWRIRLGSGIYITKEINPMVGISVGIRF